MPPTCFAVFTLQSSHVLIILFVKGRIQILVCAGKSLLGDQLAIDVSLAVLPFGPKHEQSLLIYVAVS